MAPKTKEKPKPSSSSSPAVSIEDLFTSLKGHIDKSEYEQAVKVSDQVLAIAPGDEDALCCKVVSLISDDKFDKALSTIQSSQKPLIDFGFYKAYCLYRQNNLDEALESLNTQEQTSATMLLESQILFRLGRMDACMDVFQKLQKFKIDSLEVNIVAGLVSAGRASEVQMTNSLKVNKNSSFELVYNTACSLIERGKYTDAEEHLLSARRNGMEQLTGDNWADDEIEIELAPIAVQLGYVHQLLGHPQEAMETYVDITKKNLADELSLAVAINNLVALKGPKDASDGLRKIDKLIEKADEAQGIRFADGLDVKLTSKQKEAICSNRVLLLLQGNKIDQARDLVAVLPNMFADSVMPILLQAAVLVRENKAAKAEEILGQFADKFPEKSKPILLARATIAATAGHPQIAADSLLRIPDIQHTPATVATIIALKERINDIDGAARVFDAAIHFWSNAMDEDSNNKLNIITQEAAAFKVKHGREEEAAKLYEDLVKSDGSVEALVGLVTTVARVDVDKAEAYAKKLKPLPGLKAVDVESLEKSSGAKYVEDAREIEVMGEDKGKTKSKKKRKRKPRYPKGFDPTNPGPGPDPERWLPKRERSSYRPKRKDKRAAQVRGAQGSVSKEKHDSSGSSTAMNVSSKVEQASTSKPEQPKPSSKSSRKKSRK